MSWKEIGLEIMKGMGLVVMGSYLQESISKVSRGVGSPADEKLAQAFYEKINENRQLEIDTQIDYHQGRIKNLVTEKNKLLQ